MAVDGAVADDNKVLHIVEPRPFVPYVWERSKSFHQRMKEQQLLRRKIETAQEAASEDAQISLNRHQLERQKTIPIIFDKDNTALFSPREETVSHNSAPLLRNRVAIIKYREPSNLIPVKFSKQYKHRNSGRSLAVDGVQLPCVNTSRDKRKHRVADFQGQYWTDEDEEEEEDSSPNKYSFSMSAAILRENPNTSRLHLPKVNLSHTENSTTSQSLRLARTILRGPCEEIGLTLGMGVRGCSPYNPQHESIPVGGVLSNPAKATAAAALMMNSTTQKYMNAASSKQLTLGERSIRKGIMANSGIYGNNEKSDKDHRSSGVKKSKTDSVMQSLLTYRQEVSAKG